MPRSCSICQHPQREAIDQALAAKEPYRQLTGRFGTSPAALHRHQAHVSGATTLEASALVGAAQQLATAAQALQRQAESTNSVPMMVQTLRQITSVLVEVTSVLVQLTEICCAPSPLRPHTAHRATTRDAREA